MRARLQDAFGSNQAFKRFEDQITKNIAMFQETMRMFTPFSTLGMAEETEGGKPSDASKQAEIDDLKAQLTDIRQQLRPRSGSATR